MNIDPSHISPIYSRPQESAPQIGRPKDSYGVDQLAQELGKVADCKLTESESAAMRNIRKLLYDAKSNDDPGVPTALSTAAHDLAKLQAIMLD